MSVDIACSVGVNFFVAGYSTNDFRVSLVSNYHSKPTSGFVTGSILGSPGNSSGAYVELLSVESGSLAVNRTGGTAERVGKGGHFNVV